MKMSSISKLQIKTYSRIGNIIPINQLTVVTGLPGTGKTFSTIKFLNQEGITPIYVNLDESSIGDLKADMYGKDVVKPLLEDRFTDIDGRVIVFDTYQRLMEIYNLSAATGAGNSKIVSDFENLAKRCTVIVIAHPEDYVGKDSIIKDNPQLVRNCCEHLHFDTILPRGKSASDVVNRMFIKKGRGIGGVTIIDEWLR